jgi:sugar phosphate permease
LTTQPAFDTELTLSILKQAKSDHIGAQMQKTKIFYGWWVVAAGFVLCFLFAGAGFYSFSIFIKPLEAEFGWDRAAISLTMSIHFIIGGLMGPFIGKLTQSYGPKKVMGLAAIGAGGCFLLVSLTRSLWYFYVTYAVLAVMLCGIGVVPISSLLAGWFDKRRGTATGTALVGIAAGGLLLTPLLGSITNRFGWQACYIFLGLLVWIVALPVIKWVIRVHPAEMGLAPDGGNCPGSAETGRKPVAETELEGWSMSNALHSRTFWCLALSFFLAPLAQLGVLQHQVPLIIEAGISQTTAAAALGLTAGIGGLGKLSFGRFSEMMPFRYVVTLCFGLQALAVIILVNIDSMAMLWLYVAVFGFSMGGVVVLLPLAVGHFFGLASFGVLLGIMWMINAMGGALGTYVSGLIYDQTGAYQHALVLYIGAYLVAICGIFLAGKPRPNGLRKV